MFRDKQKAILALANVYAAFHAEDYVHQVMGNLKGSHAISTEMVNELIKDKTEILGLESLSISNSNTHSRFLFECAEYALEHNLEDAMSRETWDQIKDLPSIHHAELNTIAYASADLYRTTVDKTLMNTIARDANTTAQLIAVAAQNRTSDTETGGSINMFSWGILNDGMWLSSALIKAQDSIKIFKDNTTPSPNWVNEAFRVADHTASFVTLYEGDRQALEADLNLLLVDSDNQALEALLDVVPQAELNKFIFSSATAKQMVSDWDSAKSDPNMVIKAVKEMTAYMRLLDIMKKNTQIQNDDILLSETTLKYLNQACDVVTFALVGYEALRETRFNDTLIMSVTAPSEDPKLDVYVNSDTISQYRAAHGSDEELIAFSHSLDPRTGMPVAAAGWSTQYVLDRRTVVVPEVMSKAADRLEAMRVNDARLIRDHTQKVVTDSVLSYLSARGVEDMPGDLRRQIIDLSNKVVSADVPMTLDQELTRIFINAYGDEFVSQAADILVDNLTSNTVDPQYLQAATVAQLALYDVVDVLTSDVTEKDM